MQSILHAGRRRENPAAQQGAAAMLSNCFVGGRHHQDSVHAAGECTMLELCHRFDLVRRPGYRVLACLFDDHCKGELHGAGR